MYRGSVSINVIDIVHIFQNGDTAVVIEHKTGKDITADLLAGWISRKIEDDLAAAPIADLRDILNHLSSENPTFYARKKEWSQKGGEGRRRAIQRRLEENRQKIREQNKGRETPGWSVEKLRAFYNLPEIKHEALYG